MAGRLYGVGVGPGDSKLLTLKAKEILESVDVIAVPVKASGEESRALSIVRPVVDLKYKEIMPVVLNGTFSRKTGGVPETGGRTADGADGFGKRCGDDRSWRYIGL